MKTFRNLLFAGLALAALLGYQPAAQAAVTTQVTHAWLCIPAPATGAANRQIKVPTTAGGTYNLNGEGCALVVGADIGYFISQGAFFGPNIFTLQQSAMTANTTATTSTITLPAYGYIVGVVLCETAGNAVTGGINIGDSGSATRFASAIALSANACVAVVDSALTRLFVPSGVPTADQILIAAASAFNSASVNITILYSYF